MSIRTKVLHLQTAWCKIYTTDCLLLSWTISRSSCNDLPLILNHFIAAKGYKYQVSIETGEQTEAGTKDSGVFIQLIGSSGHSGKVNIQDALKRLFSTRIKVKPGTVESFVVESSGDLGKVMIVVIGNDKSRFTPLGAAWFVNQVCIHDYQSGIQENFPCYHWIGDGDSVSFTAHTSKLSSLLVTMIFMS